jgi:hypothetical protein
LLAVSAHPVHDGVLGVWDTRTVPDGPYEISLSAIDELGLTGVFTIEVTVDNQPPRAEETSPALVIALEGGRVYTTRGDARLYFPPRCLERDATVRISKAGVGNSELRLPEGTALASGVYDVSWEGIPLRKDALLEIAAEDDRGPSATAALYVLAPDSTWRRIGGSPDASSGLVASTIREPGRYALLSGGTPDAGRTGLSISSIAPRVFAPGGGRGAREVAIAFRLGSDSPVTIRIYNRAGRLVTTLLDGERVPAGLALVRWDGLDRSGGRVPDGTYLIAIEASGRKDVGSVAVVE